ncbi:methyltransferase [Mobilicoccus pelagius]|uniref:Methyltransferase type 12 domain-containing protein n=1 Tax=Mobilicoccus pelagius NBRC 104925 TaxID=1089455 RepID=H5UNK2_9MICO|nr:methyltransferase [Mobilicoccus pelagius]GAB47310.1 hypothetical protein MOPEL_008_00020 [Mobilicoccus pelagius NBRC 104925]
MFVFGVCVDSPERFDRHCLPAIAAYGGEDATLMSSPDVPVAKTYNDVLDACLDLEGVEAVVLLRDDVEIVDPHFRCGILAAFESDPDLAVIGVGGVDADLRWWQTAGPSPAPGAPGRSGEETPRGGTLVDYVDGACMVLRPDLAARFRFDDVAFTGPGGFEVDFCHRVREAGFHVAVATIGVTRHADPDDADATYRQAAAVWQGRHARSVGLGALEHHVARLEGTHQRPERYGSVPAPHAPEGVVDVEITARHHRLLEAVPPTAGRVLQLGCGDGALGAALTALTGARVTGLDHGGGHLEQAHDRLDRVVDVDLNRLSDLDLPRGGFDAVLAVDVLDRLVDPEATLAAILPALAPDGVVVAGIPNVKHWSVVLPLLLHDRFEYRDAGLLHRGSIHLFTMVEAIAMFRRLGLGRVETCGAERVGLYDPAHLDALVACLASYGTDPEEALTMLEIYEYGLTARRA